MASDVVNSSVRISRRWWVLFAACVATLGVSDLALLQVAFGALTTGYNVELIDTPARIARLIATAAAVDAAAIALLWLVGLSLLRRWVSPARLFALAGTVAVGGSIFANLILNEIHATVGALIAPAIVNELAAGDRASFAEAGEVAALFLTLCAIGAAGALWLGLRAADAYARRRPAGAASLRPPRPALLAALALATFAMAVVPLASQSPEARRARSGMRLKPSRFLIEAIANRLSDFDRDGSGLLSQPRDPSPFDASIHGYALDIAGNGVDEDGIGGDLPIGYPAPRPAPVPVLPTDSAAAADARAQRRPHLLLIYLESVRGDVLQATVGGREVTPFLNRLAREGATSQHAYVHSPYTVRSRAQLFQGSLDPKPGAPTLIDDMHQRGYRVAYFSGQDDSFGHSAALIGWEDADVFYDARSDIARRTSRSTAPASLQVSWKTLLEHVQEFLAQHDPEQPLFLYANIVDSHYPYDHSEMDRLLDVDPVSRGEIRASQRDRVWKTYLNAVANVDRAVERIVNSARARLGQDLAIIVSSDHGQSFYESGFLGHGHALNDLQTRVPLIVVGLPAQWPEPIGAADLRGLLLRDLGRHSPGAPAPRFVADPERRIFQYLPNLDRPIEIAHRFLHRRLRHNFREAHGEGAPWSEATAATQAAMDSLARDWEALRAEGARPSG